MKYTYAEFDRLKNLPLDKKVAWSEQVILNALKNGTNVSVSCSWGKDSVVMLHLVRKFCKNTAVIFANTKCEYPETYAYRDKMLKEYSDLNYHETEPIKSFWDCVKEYGYPTFRKTAKQDKEGEKKIRTPKCCIYLKEKPLINKQKELKIDTVFIGLQATESMNRRLLFLRMGEYYYQKTQKLNYCLPMIIWNDKNIWEYIKQNNIPVNPLYKKMKRNGCMFCTGFKNWKEVMAKSNPKMYSKILKERDGQRTIQDCNLEII